LMVGWSGGYIYIYIYYIRLIDGRLERRSERQCPGGQTRRVRRDRQRGGLLRNDRERGGPVEREREREVDP
jgi:hypothetical protein